MLLPHKSIKFNEKPVDELTLYVTKLLLLNTTSPPKYGGAGGTPSDCISVYPNERTCDVPEQHTDVALQDDVNPVYVLTLLI